MICFPNAKINLGLNVTEKRTDGYHNIETIFYPIPVKDGLEIVEADHFSFHQSGIEIDSPAENNLVIKALNLIKEQYPVPELDVYLMKGIPFGAGLGGGSSDAAFMLKLINEFCSLNLSDKELEYMASVLGADCPFFIRNKPVFATGTGNIFEPVMVSLSGYYLCLVKPDITVSTPAAYSMITPQKPVKSLKYIISLPIQEWKTEMENDFEPIVFNQYPEIKKIKEKLYESGAIYACMSGSGSSVFGIFSEPVSLKEQFPSYYVWEGELI